MNKVDNAWLNRFVAWPTPPKVKVASFKEVLVNKTAQDLEAYLKRHQVIKMQFEQAQTETHKMLAGAMDL